jgi:hypothetical protein
MIFSLALCPALAYPLARVIPHYKSKGRAGSRSLAFITSAVGYTIGTLYAFLSNAGNDLKFIFCGYIVALVALTVLNKLCRLKASGHACGIMGPVFALLIYFRLYLFAAIGSVLALAVFASSVCTGEHTKGQLLGGSAIALVCISVLSMIF